MPAGCSRMMVDDPLVCAVADNVVRARANALLNDFLVDDPSVAKHALTNADAPLIA